MTGITNPISNSSVLPSQDAKNTINKLRSSNEQLFQQALAAMLLQNNLGDSKSSSGISETALIMTLLEQILENQIASQTQDSAESVQGTTAATALDTNSTVTSSSNVPEGRPVGGKVTQGSHPGHIAIDFSAPIGTEVHTTMSGKVVYAGWNDQGYGNLVIVENGPYRTYYAHLSSIPVSIGQDVSSGTVIGLSGSTGNSTGPHVHYEIRKNQVQIDPTQLTLG
jgi:murein DD-endopeptidase MepM/ murein hydrolase activator NlpD